MEERSWFEGQPSVQPAELLECKKPLHLEALIIRESSELGNGWTAAVCSCRVPAHPASSAGSQL